MDIKQISSMAQVDCDQWNHLAGDAYPFMRHEFLLALEQSGSIAVSTGWIPAHLLRKVSTTFAGMKILFVI